MEITQSQFYANRFINCNNDRGYLMIIGLLVRGVLSSLLLFLYHRRRGINPYIRDNVDKCSNVSRNRITERVGKYDFVCFKKKLNRVRVEKRRLVLGEENGSQREWRN